MAIRYIILNLNSRAKDYKKGKYLNFRAKNQEFFPLNFRAKFKIFFLLFEFCTFCNEIEWISDCEF